MARAPISPARSRTAATTRRSDPPLAIIALTDGDANDSRQNNKAVSALLERHIPVYAIGFGSDAGPATLGLVKWSPRPPSPR